MVSKRRESSLQERLAAFDKLSSDGASPGVADLYSDRHIVSARRFTPGWLRSLRDICREAASITWTLLAITAQDPPTR